MRPIWNGTISFGLVNIPVAVYPATSSERLGFNLLHEKDGGRIRYASVCKECGKELSRDEIVKGYEYVEGEYVVLTADDFAKAAAGDSKSISIVSFVEAAEIDPMFFDKPYYLAPGKNADKTYTLLREALKGSKRVAVARFALRDREHLAAIKAHGAALMLETMHFADEIADPEGLKLPDEDAKVGAPELEMAKKLIGMMEAKFEPEQYVDTYRVTLQEIIEQKAKGAEVKSPSKKRAAPTTNVVDIMSKLKESLAKSSPVRKAARSSSKKKKAKKAA